jgi:2-oxo-4-hydroxy-4-carboxy-5-ureidoimidazoline decarboxylase
VAIREFNALAAAGAEAALGAVCAAPGWARDVAAGRPYAAVDDLVAAGLARYDRLGWAELAAALAAHPRIGQRPAGESPEAAWSRREQAGVADADARVQEALAEANRAYEERFGHLFLIFASGRSAPEILAAARERLGNDEETEHAVVRVELRQIVRLRLERLVSG